MKQNPEYKIFIVDDEESVCKGISLLLLSVGYHVDTFDNAKDFLNSDKVNGPGCILLDVFLRGESGLDLQDNIKERYSDLPIIYITGHGDVSMSVKAFKNGALNFLQKPIDEKQLFPAVEEAINQSLALVSNHLERNIINAKFNSLTPRELEIFRHVIRGTLNKQIAAELHIAEHTVKLHRGKITEKLGVKSVPEMIYMADKLDIK
jgi:FixJ family two-component response regulator